MLPEIKKSEERDKETRRRPFLIEKGAVEGLPPDAVVLSKQEALRLQYDMVYNWENKSDIWPFRWGPGILSSAVAISSIFITNYYRKRTKLFHYGRLPMYLPTVILPSLFLPVIHQKVVAEPILLQDRCPICVEIRSIALQFAFGIIYPTLLASMTSFLIATHYATCDLPLYTGLNLLEMGRAWARISSKLNSRLFWIWPMHAVFAAAITYFQANSFYKIQQSIIEKRNE